MSLLEINPLVVTKDGKLRLPRRARSTSTATRSSATRNRGRLRDIGEEDPAEIEASKYDLAYVKLDGDDRLPGQRRRPRHGDHGHHQALRRRARQLPRRRRRRSKEKVRGGLQDHPLRPEREGHPGQHLRRHHALRHHRRRRGRGGARRWPSRCRWSCASKAPTSSSARRSWPSIAASRSCPPTTSPTRAKKITDEVKKGPRVADPPQEL